MDPNQNPAPAPTNPEPTAAPAPPVATPPVAPAAPSVAPAAPASAAAPMPAKKGHTRLLIAVVLLIVVGLLAYMLTQR